MNRPADSFRGKWATGAGRSRLYSSLPRSMLIFGNDFQHNNRKENMTTIEQEPKLVVFWTLKKRGGYETKRYNKTRMATEYPADKNPDEAVKEILDEHGRVADLAPGGSPNLQHADIFGHSIIRHQKRAQIETWKASQEQLFDAVEWQRCVSYAK